MSTNNFDLTSKFSEFLDVHQLLKILQFYESQGIYSNNEILNARLELLAKTNMVGFAVEVRKNAGLEVTAEMESQGEVIMEALNELKAKHQFLSLFDAERRDELLKIGENWNFAYLAQHHKVEAEQLL
jgi:translation initiation factor 3 subunit E